jgi:cell fate regulator YaaT (PSP1 superfamily)
MARVVGIRFRQAGKIFYYDAVELDLAVSQYVVVESAHGLSVGRVVITPEQMISSEGVTLSELKPVLRLATEDDVDRAETMKERAGEALRRAKLKVSEQQLDMSIASGEFDLEGGQFTAYFTANERVDFRGLVRDLSRELGARVQLLQVGDRDRAKLADGVDICGERLCCSSWMTSFPAVSIRMAKEQDLPLNPQKISGVCGRLYCCLTFEYEDYRALRGTLPKVGSFLSTPAGEAKVLGIDFNREVVRLMLTADHQMFEVPAIDFRLQNGVTIRPMELVQKIESPLRPIGEAREALPLRLPRSRPERPGQRERQPAQGDQRPVPGAGERPAGRQRQRPQGMRPTPPLPAPATEQTPAAQDAAGQRKRRRRRRGRGQPQGGGPSSPAPS